MFTCRRGAGRSYVALAIRSSQDVANLVQHTGGPKK